MSRPKLDQADAVVKVSLGATLEADEGNIDRFSREVTAGLVKQLAVKRWDPEKIKLTARIEADAVYVTVEDGVNVMVAKIELEGSPVSTGVH